MGGSVDYNFREQMLLYLKRASCSEGDMYLVVPAVVIFVLGSYIANVKLVFITIISYLLFVLPGFIFLKLSKLSSTRSLIYGAPLGFAITSLIFIIKVALTGWDLLFTSVWYVALLIAIGSGGYLVGNSNRQSFFEDDGASEVRKCIPCHVPLLISLYLLIIFIALKDVGKLTEFGYSFTGLFGHDFLLRGVDSIAIAGGVPSENYFFSGVKTYNYYILWYMLPATVYNLIDMQGDIRDIISIVCLINVPFFYSLVYLSLVDFTGISRGLNEGGLKSKSALIFILMLFCYSWHWMFVLGKKIISIMGLGYFNRFFEEMGSLSQSWFRDIIFEPHVILAIMMILLIIKLARLRDSFGKGLIIGLILGAVGITDTCMFVIFGTAYFGYELIKGQWSRNAAWRGCFLGTSLAMAIVLSVMFLLEVLVVPEYSNKIIFKPYTVLIVTLPIFLILEYGPVPITCMLGIKKGGWYDKDYRMFMTIIILVCMLFMLFVSESLEGNVFLRKALYLLTLPLWLFTGTYVCYTRSITCNRLLLVLLMLSLPTSLTDVWSLTDVGNKENTTYISRGEMEAALWMKRNTPRNSIVQGLIDYPGRFDYSLTICFGERKAALGHWKMAIQRHPNRERIRERADQISRMFLAEDGIDKHKIAVELGIDYIFVGRRERDQYAGCETGLSEDEDGFERVFDNREARVYKVLLKCSERKDGGGWT